MKFIFVVMMFSFLFVMGCGQSSPPKNPAINTPSTPTGSSNPNTVATDNSSTAAPVDGNATVVDGSKNMAPQTPSSTQEAIVAPPVVAPPVAEDYHQSVLNKISSQEDLLEKEQAAFNRAVRAKDKDVHFTKDFLIAISTAVGSGVVAWDFLHKTNVVEKGPVTYYKKLVPGKKTAAVGEEEAVAAIDVESASMLAKLTSGVSTLVLGYFAFRYAINTERDVSIHFSSTDERNIAEARKELAAARANLHALWNPPDNGPVPQY